MKSLQQQCGGSTRTFSMFSDELIEAMGLLFAFRLFFVVSPVAKRFFRLFSDSLICVVGLEGSCRLLLDSLIEVICSVFAF